MRRYFTANFRMTNKVSLLYCLITMRVLQITIVYYDVGYNNIRFDISMLVGDDILLLPRQIYSDKKRKSYCTINHIF